MIEQETDDGLGGARVIVEPTKAPGPCAECGHRWGSHGHLLDPTGPCNHPPCGCAGYTPESLEDVAAQAVLDERVQQAVESKAR